MSLLVDATVLFVGEINDKLSSVQDELLGRGSKVLNLACSDVSRDYINKQKVNLIVVNYLDERNICDTVLSHLKGEDLSTPIPVFALVADDTTEIQTVLTEGAADYITVNEDLEEIMQKIEAVVEGDTVFSGNSAIDITPIQADVSSKGIKVFAIEDDPLLRNLLSIRMDKSDFPYEFSVDGKDVLPAMKNFNPDVIILDLMLPGRSGFEVLEEIKSDSQLKDTPVIVLSNKDGVDDRRKAKELGANSFYVKAMTDLAELVETIEELVK